MTYDQQIQKLKDKHLVIPNEAAAKETLRLNSYFALITGYKNLFKNPTTKDYRDGTTFDDIVTLYGFPSKLEKGHSLSQGLISRNASQFETHFDFHSAGF